LAHLSIRDGATANGNIVATDGNRGPGGKTVGRGISPPGEAIIEGFLWQKEFRGPEASSQGPSSKHQYLGCPLLRQVPAGDVRTGGRPSHWLSA
jgi:hypothetical protein